MTDTPSAEMSAKLSDGLDLTPREHDIGIGRKKRWPAVVLVVVAAALVFVLFKSLAGASLFFYNADEAIEKRVELGEERFNLQGTPFGEVLTVDVGGEPSVVFSVAFDGVVADVVHIGNPAELFQPTVPVVLEGHWIQGRPAGVDAFPAGANDGWYFSSSRMLVKHDSEYRLNEQERIAEAEQGGYEPSGGVTSVSE